MMGCWIRNARAAGTTQEVTVLFRLLWLLFMSSHFYAPRLTEPLVEKKLKFILV